MHRWDCLMQNIAQTSMNKQMNDAGIKYVNKAHKN